MGVATLITVMTIVQGANAYVENRIANLGTDVFQIAKTPFVVTDWDRLIGDQSDHVPAQGSLPSAHGARRLRS